MRRYWILAVALPVTAVCVRLGIWQLDRLSQRRARNDSIAARLEMSPFELTSESGPDSLAFRWVTVSGTFDFERQIVVVARSYDGVPAVNVVTPLLMRSGQAVLVERGHVPSPDAKTVDLDELAEPDTTEAVGVLVPVERAVAPGNGWPRYVRNANPAGLQAEYPYELFPLVLRRTKLPTRAPARMEIVPLPELTGGPHLSYAIQWFAFAVIAMVGAGVLLWRSSPQARPGRNWRLPK